MELAHAAERKAFSIAIDGALKHVKKDREKSFLQLIDLAENFMGGDKFEKEDYDRRGSWSGIRKESGCSMRTAS